MKNYIFGTGPFAYEVAKKLDESGIDISGFLKLKEKNKPQKIANVTNILFRKVDNPRDISLLYT